MKLLLYDVETAGKPNTGSICAVGWMLLDSDHHPRSGYSLINPRCAFNKHNIEVHGITPADVENAPCFPEYWESTLKNLMTSSIVVAHNARFDLRETQQALYNARIEDPDIDYFDSLEMLRNLVNADSYKLSNLADIIGYTYSAHNAMEDVKALYAVLQYVRDLLQFSSIPEMMLRSHIAVENTLSNSYAPRTVQKSFGYDHTARCTDPVDVLDQAFSGLRFCFTGQVDGYERPDLERMILQHAGRVTGSVSSRTDYLVVGSYGDYGNAYVSGKQKTAAELAQNGGKIKIISPEEFFALVNACGKEET